jgi:hypothetical protein
MARDLYRESFTKYSTVDLDYELPIWKEGTNKDAALKRISLRDLFASDLVQTVLDPPNWATGNLTLTGIRQHNLGNYSLTLANGTFITAADLNVNMLGTVKLPNAASDNTITKVLGIDSTTGQIKYTTGITNGSIAPMAANTFKANITGGTAAPTDVARADLTNSLPYAADSVVGFTAAGDLVRFTADKLLNTMTSQATSEGSITVDLGSMQVKAVTALGISAAIPAPIGTPTNGMSLTYRLKDDGTSRTLTWDAIFRGVNGVTLPTATLGTVSDLLIIKCLYNVADSKWDVYFVGGGAGLSDSDYGDITVSGSGTVMTIDDGVVSNAKLADVATSTFKGRATAGSGDPEDLTAAQARTILNVEDGADVTDATNVTAAGALMDSELTDLAGVKGVTISTLQVKPAEGAFADGDKTKLDGIETGATADQTASEIRTLLGTGNSGVVPAAGTAGHFLKHDGTFGLPNYTTNTDTQLSDAEVETAYNNQVDVVTQVDAEAGTSTDVKRWTAQRVKQAIDALAGGTPALNNGQIFVGNASNAATSVAMSGDTAITNTGVVTIQPDVVTYDKMQDVTQACILGKQSGAGTVDEIPVSQMYLSVGATTVLLENTANWDVNGVYTGTAITGTYQGQAHVDGNYWFTATDDNVWIRLIRG